MIRLIAILILIAFRPIQSLGQKEFSISGHVLLEQENADNVLVLLLPDSLQKYTNDNGNFRFNRLSPGKYTILVRAAGFNDFRKEINLNDKSIQQDVQLKPKDYSLKMVEVSAKNELASGRMNDVAGTSINAGKKSEVIYLKNINANLATNNTRQIYARIPGLNIWEYDRGGLQLGIGGRGLSPNRSSNFNVRQNGYDISADALGYPESYYTPSAEAIDRIEIIRGASSLQYGPQFGGLINFVMKEGNKTKKAEVTSRQTLGSYGFFNSFNSVGGTVAKNKLNYYTFYQFKRGDDWRPNSHYEQHSAYAHLAYQLNNKIKITGQYTFMQYNAQQPGGLTDAAFEQNPAQSFRARNWFAVNWNLISLNVDYNINPNTRLNWRSYTLQGGRAAVGILSNITRPDNAGLRDVMLDKYNNFGSELRLIHQYQLLGQEKSTFLVGARAYRGLTLRQQGDGTAGSDADFKFFGAAPNSSDYRFPGNNLAVFAENIFQINKRWSITPGIRAEHINTKADGHYFKKNIFIASERIDELRANPRTFTLLGIGTSYRFNNGLEFYGNISQNYRSINFNDIRVVNVNARVDPNIKDENGYNADLGSRGNLWGWMYYDLSVFYLRYNDRIGSVFARDSNYMPFRLRTNVADSRNIGVEFLVEGDVLKALKGSAAKYKLNLYTNISRIDARYINTQNTAIANKLVENVPPFLLRCGAAFGNHRFNISYQYSYQTKQYSEATNAEITPNAIDGAIPKFSVMDLSLSYNWRHFTVFTGINNLLNRSYFTRRADGYPGPGIIPSDRRNLYITLQVKR